MQMADGAGVMKWRGVLLVRVGVGDLMGVFGSVDIENRVGALKMLVEFLVFEMFLEKNLNYKK